MQRTVIVTGSSGGIGTKICEAFKAENWTVIGIDKSNAFKTHCDHHITLDLEDLGTKNDNLLRESLAKIEEVHGRLKVDTLINNAGVQICCDFDKLTTKDFQKTFAVNLFAPFQLIKTISSDYSGPNLRIVNIGSIHSDLSKSGFAAYAASKAALRTMTTTLAIELGDRATLCLIEPGAINTKMLQAGFPNQPGFIDLLGKLHPSGCIGEPESLAEIAVFLSTMPSKFINGCVLNFDGGVRGMLTDL